MVNRRYSEKDQTSFQKKAVLDLWLMGGQPTDVIRVGMLEVEVRRAELELGARREYFVIDCRF